MPYHSSDSKMRFKKCLKGAISLVQYYCKGFAYVEHKHILKTIGNQTTLQPTDLHYMNKNKHLPHIHQNGSRSRPCLKPATRYHRLEE